MISEFESQCFKSPNGVHLPYRLYHTASKALKPLVIFLHGSGERGVDNVLPLTANDSVPTLYQYAKEVEDAIILVPQAPYHQKIGAWVFDDISEALTGLMTFIINHYPVDRQRIYIIGLSHGGAGVWNLLVKKPHLFAAAINICGYIHGQASAERVLARPITKAEAKRMCDTPVWVFHAEDDDVVHVDHSRAIVSALEKVGNQHVIYTEYEAGVIVPPHCSWDRAFQTSELLPWLFSQKKTGG